MKNLALPALAAMTTLTLSSAAMAQWVWKNAATPSIANGEGLRLGGAVACKVVAGNKTYLGGVANGLCEYENDAREHKKAQAPGYEFLATSGGGSVQTIARPIFGIPRGVIRAAPGETGPVLCSADNKLGWLNRAGEPCRTTSKVSVSNQGQVSLFFMTPINSFVDLPPLWRDLNTTGGSANNRGYCRASLTGSSPKVAPGVFSDAGGGTCHFLAGVSTSGEVIFAKTTDKNRFLVLFPSTNNWERLFLWGVNSNARLRAGIVGSEHAYACAKDQTRGIFFRNACVAPPAAGNGAGVALPGAVSEAPGGITLLTVFDQG